MMLSSSGRPAATSAPNTTSRTISAAGTPKISAFSMSLLATWSIIWFRLASPVWASVKPWPAPATTTACSLSTCFMAVSWSPAMTTGSRAPRPSLETSVRSLVA